MKKALLFIMLLSGSLAGNASHIVGGEFELIHLTGIRYRFNMILYFDELHGDNSARDDLANVRIFRMSDNKIMADLPVPRMFTSSVGYTQPACAHGEIVTTKYVFTIFIDLSPTIFNDPGGYYAVYGRCCRNYGITNIISEQNFPNNVGQSFYMEFPPVVKDGLPFIDSTPRLFPPLNDYACPNRPYYADFRGVDDDGDSLVYSMVTPLDIATGGGNNNPSTARPYPEVRWRPGYSLNSIMKGAPDLRITRDGILSVTPTIQGLFVFAVKIESFRDKKKIGETRRDFQLLVVDHCDFSDPPQILGKKLTDPTYTYDNTMQVSFTNTVPANQRCVMVKVTDPDANNPLSFFSETVKIKAIPINFKGDVSAIIPAVSDATLIYGGFVEFQICFPECPLSFTGGDPVIGIIAMDDACSVPLMDTLKITVHVESPQNSKPRFIMPVVNPASATLNEGTRGSWPFDIVDDDGDELVITVLTNGFDMATAGMTLNTLHQTLGAADGELKWDAFCDIYNFTQRTSFQVTLQVEDRDFCLSPNPANQVFNLNVILPGNTDPTIDTDLTPVVNERYVTGITRSIYETLNFKVTGKDLTDNDALVLSAKGKNFVLSDYGIVITPNPASAMSSVSSDLGWTVNCTSVDLKKKDTFDFQFIVVDNQNKCRIYKADTVDVSVKILPPPNLKPQLVVVNENSSETTLTSDYRMSMTVGNAVRLSLTGTDGDNFPAKDNLKLELVKFSGNVDPEGFNFRTVSGNSPVQTNFRWQPDCSIFKDRVFTNDYSFMFRLSDDHCASAKSDTVEFKLTIRDVDGSDSGFIPPNFFSPNGDNINDYFAMEMKDHTTGELTNILPKDNCEMKFESVRIYDRWGKEVFRSAERDFKWDGKGEIAGVYFYYLKYTEREYRGTVLLRF
ncbi:MAG: hypothetical protein HOP08_12205 [Cyclobacteriaceae bacterium]|nr:hypothetical protein [Cyclobacteriaceae bacterium]